MKNKILTGLLLVLIGGWGNLLAQNAGSNYARQVNTLIGTKGVGEIGADSERAADFVFAVFLNV